MAIELKKPAINDLRHPQYVMNQLSWEKWRLTYLGGERFLRRYMKKHSKREDDTDYRERLAVSYVPAFAKSAVNEVKNSIFQRISDVTRVGGAESYVSAMCGLKGGVDLHGSTMNAFIGRDILPELLTMAKVGVYVDMPPIEGATQADRLGKRPYMYWYKAEDIRSWSFQDERNGDPTEFRSLLLRDNAYNYEKEWVLPTSVSTTYRHMWIGEDGYVHVQFFDSEGVGLYPRGVENGKIIRLEIRKIPFVMMTLSDSLLADVADYQITLLNLASTDIAFALRANFPFYTEMVDWRTRSPYVKDGQGSTITNSIVEPAAGELAGFYGQPTNIVNQSNAREIPLGIGSGREYPLGTERPGFIHPSPEPMKVSMEKQKQLKEEIRQLVALAITSLQPRPASAESKDLDNQGLEAGLSYIGLELEHGERKIAEFWAMYEGGDAPTVQYPTQYSLLTDAERLAKGKELKEMMPNVPSLTYQKEIAKEIAVITVGGKVSHETMVKIKQEIDEAKVVVTDPEVIAIDLEAGLVSTKTASRARLYPPGEDEAAKIDHADRLERIAASQGETAGNPGARGVPDLAGDTKGGKAEKTGSQKIQDTRGEVKDRTRGKGQ